MLRFLHVFNLIRAKRALGSEVPRVLHPDGLHITSR